jgi:hypothetical protein
MKTIFCDTSKVKGGCSFMAARASIRLKNTQANAREQRQEPNTNPGMEEQIRKRAYDIYRQRDSQAGSEVDDWLQAEAEMRASHRPTERSR